MNVLLIFAYNGSKFLGSQQQSYSKNTVTKKLIEVLKKYNITAQPILSSRTDRGVHALGQTATLILPSYWNDLKKLKDILNISLTPDIFIRQIKPVSESFHARYSATKRIYRYIITNKKSIFTSDYMLYRDSLNITKVNETLKLFEGSHNFEYFQSRSGTKNYTRTIYKAFAYRYGNYTVLYFSANGFLRNQIRFIVSAVLAVHDNKISIMELKEQIDLKNIYIKRKITPAGLYLSKILYS